MRLILAALVLVGCAGPDAATCRSADWYDLGFRDAIFGIQPQHDVYSAQCEKVDAARYVQGWREGKYEADSRHGGSPD